jgi:hypothetical protein
MTLTIDYSDFKWKWGVKRPIAINYILSPDFRCKEFEIIQNVKNQPEIEEI